MITTITARMPVIEIDGNLVVLVAGNAEVGFGDEVALATKAPARIYPSLYVLGVDELPADEVAQEVLALFGMLGVKNLIQVLSKVYGTAYGDHVPVTIYTLADHAFFEVEDVSLDQFVAEFVEQERPYQVVVGVSTVSTPVDVISTHLKRSGQQ